MECNEASGSNESQINLFNLASSGNYWSVILRDIVTLFLIVWFTHKVIASNVTMESKVNVEDLNAFMDFDIMLVSVLPHNYFIKFLQADKKSYQPYLQLIHIY